MKTLCLASALLTITAAAQAAVDPALLNLVMPDAQAIAGIQVAEAQASPFGRYLLAGVMPNANFDKLSAATGFDPRRDLTEVIAASAAPGSKIGLILGAGVFQPGRLATLAAVAGTQAETYNGITILNGTGKDQGSVAFLDAATVAMGDNAAVKAAIDRRAAGTQFSGPLADKVRSAAGSNQAWAVTTAPLSVLANPKSPAVTPLGPPANLLQSILQLSGGMRFDSAGISVNGEALTNSPQDAQALRDVLTFFVNMAQPGGTAPAPAAALLSAAQFSTDGPTVRLSLVLPEDQAEKLIPVPKSSTASTTR